MAGYIQRPEPGKAEENHRILHAFAAESRHRLLVLGEYPENPAIRRVQEILVVISERGGVERFGILSRHGSFYIRCSGLGNLGAVITVVDGLGDSDPDIQQSKAGDKPADR